MAYIGNSPDTIQQGRRFIYEFTATAGQTVFSGADDNNQTLDLLEANEQSVFLNGVRLIPTDDYTVSGDTLTLTSAASLNDFLVVETQAEVANISTYTRAESDARYVNYNGDIISGNLQITGNVSVASGNISLGDNDKAIFGAGSDLQIYHDGSHSYIDEQGTGSLQLRATNLNIKSAANETYIACVADGQVELNYNNTTRLATTNTGINVTGTVTTDGLTVDGNGSLLTLDNGSNPATLSNTNGNVTLDFDTTNNGRSYIIQGNNINVFKASNGGDISFYEDTGTNAKFFWDASAERLGIGTTSPSRLAELYGTSNPALRINNGTDIADIGLASSAGALATSSTSGALVIARGGANDINLATNGVNRVTIDSSGNLLVGRTSSSGTAEGVRILNDGFGGFHRDGAEVIQVDRKTSDGTLISLRKDGGEVGSIGVATAGASDENLYISNGDTGLRFRYNDDSIVPSNNTGSFRDNAIDLGLSNARFKDLYLSGGVYLGGTGSANKLDDYEEGTWTPTLAGSTTNPSLTYNTQAGAYEKIGAFVHVSFFILVGAVSSQGSGQLRIGGLPFSTTSTVASAEVPAVLLQTEPFNDGDGSGRQQYARTQTNSTALIMGYKDGNGGATVPANAAANVGTGYLIGHLVYKTNS